uniref:Histone-lysine N-methyltransferase NSD2 n=1 Tax=Phallusia mammillata TaxID=59560 RepID=A0A6F9DLY1_9ASCI|nr:Histone-lysine N-methyltransferase NSD2 [Phallusia mammillata]
MDDPEIPVNGTEHDTMETNHFATEKLVQSASPNTNTVISKTADAKITENTAAKIEPVSSMPHSKIGSDKSLGTGTLEQDTKLKDTGNKDNTDAQLDDSLLVSKHIIEEMLESVMQLSKPVNKESAPQSATPLPQKNLMTVIANVDTPSPRMSKRKRVPKKSLDYDDEDKKKEEKVVSPPRPVKEKVVPVETEINWKLGDLVWAYVPGHPLWPCMITIHPEEDIFTKMHGRGPKGCRVYHVQFLGDRPERGWINERRVFLYKCPEDYEKIITDLTAQSKKMALKVPRVDIPVRLKQDWDSAVDEIQEAVPHTAEERIKIFGYDFKPYIKKLIKPAPKPDNGDENSFHHLLMVALEEDLAILEKETFYEDGPEPVQGIALPEKNCNTVMSGSILNSNEKPKEKENFQNAQSNPQNFCPKQCAAGHVELQTNGFSTDGLQTSSQLGTEKMSDSCLSSNSGIEDLSFDLCASMHSQNLHNITSVNTSVSTSNSDCSNVVEIADNKQFLPQAKAKLLIHYTRSKKKHLRASTHDSGLKPLDPVHLLKLAPNKRRKCTSESNVALEKLHTDKLAPELLGLESEDTYLNETSGKKADEKLGECSEKNITFHQCLGLIAKVPSVSKPESNIITTKRAEKAVAALKVQTNINLSVCTCTALQENRGFGENTYTIQNLIDAIKRVEEGFPYRHVAVNFRIPATTLWDYTKGKKILVIKHHSSCAMFFCGKYVIIDHKIHHIKLIGECRRLQLNQPAKRFFHTKPKLAKTVKTPAPKPPPPPPVDTDNGDIIQFTHSELLSAWRTYLKPKSLKQYKKDVSSNEQFTECKYRLAMRKCMQGSSVFVATAAYNIPIQAFCNRVKYFSNGLVLPKAQSSSQHNVINKARPAHHNILEDMQKASNSKSQVKYTQDHNYTNEDVLISMDKILSGSASISHCTREYGIPNTTIRDCLKRNTSLYRKLIRSKRMPEEKRLIILKANQDSFRIAGPRISRKRTHLAHKASSGGLKSNRIQELKQNLSEVSVRLEDNVSLRHKSLLKRHQKHRWVGRNFSMWKYTSDDLSKAVTEVQKGGRIGLVAATYGIPHSTLKDNAFGRRKPAKVIRRRNSRAIHGLAVELEAEISSALKTQLDWGFSLSKDMISKLISDYLLITDHNDIVTDIWLKYFCIRNNIEYCDPQAQTTPTEADPFLTYAMFDKLEKISQVLGLDNSPSQMYLVQEFLVKLTDLKNSSIVSIINASGEKFNPLVIVSGGVIWNHSCRSAAGLRPELSCAFSEHGQFDQNLFETWLESFLKVQQPGVILLDSPLAKLPIRLILSMVEKKVAILKLPHASSSVVFDVPYNKVVKETLANISSKSVKKFVPSDIMSIARDMWTDVLTPETIVSCFDESGLFPINRDKYPAETFSDEKLHEFCLRAGTSARVALQGSQSPQSSNNSLHVENLTAENETHVGRKLKKIKQRHAVKRLNSARALKNEKLRKIQKQKILQEKGELKEKLLNGPKSSSDFSLPETEMFELYCQRHKPSIAAQNPEMTPEQLEAMIWMEWEALSTEERKISVESELNDLAGSKKQQRRSSQNETKYDEEPLPLNDDGETFSCPVCHVCYPTKFSLGQHKRWCIPANESKAKKMSGKNGKVLAASHDFSNSVSENGTTEISGFAFTCEKCHEKFFSAKALQIHRKFCSHVATSLVSRSPRQKLKTSRASLSRSDLPRKKGGLQDEAGRRKSLDQDDRSSSRRSSNHDDASSNGDESNGTVRRSRWKGPQLGSTTKRENICAICERLSDDLVSCTGGCCQSYHPTCAGLPSSDNFSCKNCKEGTHPCFICNKNAAESSPDLGDIKKCNVQNCGRSYHTTCLHLRKIAILGDLESDKSDKSDRFSLINNSRCTLHHCATCASKAVDDGTACMNVGRQRMFKCVRCPTAYHAGDDCIAAGSVILPGLNIICPDHFSPHKATPHHQPVHVSWCFVCSKGGQLMCCEGCPAAFHPTCVDMESPPDGEWFCHDCRHRRRPLYGDIVWVKLGSYRWWPGEITHPNEIPDNIQRLHHGIGEFVVKFFGSNDYFWLNKRRVFAYQEGDTGATAVNCSRGISSVFNKALQVARERFENIATHKQKIQDLKTQNKKPSYKHIKINRPCGSVQVYTADPSEISRCICKRSDQHPCGPESECLNRMLMYECHPTLCPAGDKCENQNFQKRAYPESEVFKTNWGGWGLRTKVKVKKGEFVNEYVGELVDNEECLRRIEQAHKNNVTNFYMLTIDKDRIIDAGPKGNYSRFMNHSCDPSCETQKWTVNGDTRVGLFARKDIPEGGELTFNYNLDCLGNDKTPCMCGAKNCSGFIGVRPKPQMNAGNGNLQSHRNKRKKKKADSRIVPKHDDFCFRCRQTGTLVCCDVRGCQRAFCLSCLRLSKPPFGKWECPWHHCDFCGRRAQSFCHFCPNSFCASHVKNQLVESVPNKYDCCIDHDPNVAEYEIEEAIVTVAQSMIPPETWNESVDDPVSVANYDFIPETKPRGRTRKAPKVTEPDPEMEPDPETQLDEKTELPKRKRGRPRKSLPLPPIQSDVNAIKTEVCSVPSSNDSSQFADENNVESDVGDSDDELGPTMTSPVKRKRTKAPYFKGRKKKRRKSIKDRNVSSPQEGDKEVE